MTTIYADQRAHNVAWMTAAEREALAVRNENNGPAWQRAAVIAGRALAAVLPPDIELREYAGRCDRAFSVSRDGVALGYVVECGAGGRWQACRDGSGVAVADDLAGAIAALVTA